MDKLTTKFQDNCFSMEEEAILALRDVYKSGEINAVITGLEKHCYGVYVVDDTDDLKYEMFYISNKPELAGFIISLSSAETESDELTFLFAKHLSLKYPSIDLISAFNTLQGKVRQVYEMYNIITQPVTIKDLNTNRTYMVKGYNGIKTILMIDKLDFYRDHFQADKYEVNEAKEKCVYLMLNIKNSQIKIGQSIDPKFREKTLMGQEPSIYVVAAWIAPVTVEKELHRKFKLKNVRGEWFNLNFQDCESIKSYMKEYSQIECY